MDGRPLGQLVDWLDYNGYTVVTKAIKEFIDASGRRKVKGNMDIELAVDAMELAERVDQIALFSGDGDFRSLVEAVQRRGVRVTVVSTISSQPPMIADELRRQADIFTDLVELRSKIGRDVSDRPSPRQPRPKISDNTYVTRRYLERVICFGGIICFPAASSSKQQKQRTIGLVPSCLPGPSPPHPFMTGAPVGLQTCHFHFVGRRSIITTSNTSNSSSLGAPVLYKARRMPRFN